MKAITLEIRDKGTFIPALAVNLRTDNEEDRYLLARAGFGTDPAGQGEYTILMRLEGPEAQYDPSAWAGMSRTMPVAHRYIIDNFERLKAGDVVDVQFVLYETERPKISERFL